MNIVPIQLRAAVCAFLFLGGCGDDGGGSSDGTGGTGAGTTGGLDSGTPSGGMDAGTDAAITTGTGGTGGTTGGTGGFMPPPTIEPVVCGDGDAGVTCEITQEAANLGVVACCTAANECGEETPIAAGTCLEYDQPGGADPSCPPYEIMGFTTWFGCCTPEGQCGSLGGAYGCVPNSTFGQPEQSCDYDPDNDCERIVVAACDGAEDCDGGQMCCGQWQSGYRRFICADDCLALEATEGGTWSEICHPGDTCTVDGYTCNANTEFLPDYLYRCRDTGVEATEPGSTAAGEINCGDGPCGAAEICCLSYRPGDPIEGTPECRPAADGCACAGGGGSADAGT